MSDKNDVDPEAIFAILFAIGLGIYTLITWIISPSPDKTPKYNPNAEYIIVQTYAEPTNKHSEAYHVILYNPKDSTSHDISVGLGLYTQFKLHEKEVVVIDLNKYE